jgi:hypothetical protein
MSAGEDAETFLHELRLLAKTPEQAERFIASWRGVSIRLSVRGVTPYKLATAAMMLRTGQSRAEAREALMERYGVSRRTAYRILQAAIDQGPI